MHARYLLPQLPKLDYVLVYAGLNDVGLWLYQKEFSPRFMDSPQALSSIIAESFRVSNHVQASWPWYKKLELWRSASKLKALAKTRANLEQKQTGRIVQDERMAWLAQAQKARQRIEKGLVPRAKMDSYPAAFDAYAKNLGAIAREIKKAGAKPIFMAQAIRWTGLGDAKKKKLWMGTMDGGAAYATEAQMESFVRDFNQRMAQVAQDSDPQFIVLPALPAEHENLYFDGCHFHERGARIVAEALSKALTPLFSQ